MKKLIDVYPYQFRNGEAEFLILKRSATKIYAGQWRMIGGKVQKGETSWQAGLRELKEETSVTPCTYWVIPSVNKFYEANSDCIHHIPAFAAEVDEAAQITLDDEHSGHKWITIQDVESYIKWPEQRRLIRMAHEILTDSNQQILPEWIIEPD
ncbi:MAG: NUDIX pyrophosphatase [Balneolaceae bacterium]|nr:NUDIX pyrophosphatase [Balneolaceae bacterium]